MWNLLVHMFSVRLVGGEEYFDEGFRYRSWYRHYGLWGC